MRSEPPLLAVINAFAIRHAGRLAAHLETDWRIETVADDAPCEPRRSILGHARALVATRFDRSVPVGPDLALIQSPVAGYDRVDLAAIPPRAAFCNVHEHEGPVAEYVLAAMLEWAIGLRRLDAGLRRGDWGGGYSTTGSGHREIAGATLGLVGLGRIGTAIASRAAAFGMRILATTRRPRPPAAAVAALLPIAQLDCLLAESDFVVLACPLDETTRGLIDAQRLARMKPGAMLINVSRAAIVDEAALHAALRERRIGGAAIDVWPCEPGPDDPSPEPSQLPFHELDNVIMTPHAAASTEGVLDRRWRFVARNLDRLARGEPLDNVVVGPASGATRPG